MLSTSCGIQTPILHLQLVFHFHFRKKLCQFPYFVAAQTVLATACILLCSFFTISLEVQHVRLTISQLSKSKSTRPVVLCNKTRKCMQYSVIRTLTMNRCSKPSAVYSTIDYSNLHETASAAYRCASC